MALPTPPEAREPPASSASFVVPKGALSELFSLLRGEGYTVIGPTVRDEAIVYDELDSDADLPIGWTDEQAPGRYRLARRADEARFGFVVGPHSWKRYLFPPREKLVQLRARREGAVPEPVVPADVSRAFVGVRACELAAIEIQDAVFLGGPYRDARYEARRDACFVVVVHCVEAGELCFCASMGTGPRARGGYDLGLTELDDVFVVEAGSERGADVLRRWTTDAAPPERLAERDAAIERCAENMGRTLDTRELPERLFANLTDAHWHDVAARCLSCGNCTMVCPTCFCFTVEDHTELATDDSARTRTWDSCFHLDHGSIHGAQFRPTTRDRYQQWVTHKLASWTTQFGTSGCVGCGRCIAWCPVGIDLTAEAARLAETDARAVLPEVRKHARLDGDPLLPLPAVVTGVVRETEDVVTLRVRPSVAQTPSPGQFNMVSLPGIGDVPISVSGVEGGEVLHTIRSVGAATQALTALTSGESVFLRGPFGSSWPLLAARGRPVVVIAGGIGLAPLRGALRAMLADEEGYPDVRLYLGARRPADLLFQDELGEWRHRSRMRVSVTVDHAAPGWTGNIGVVTRVLRRKDLPGDALYFVCGPEIMMHFVLETLRDAGIGSDQIYLSMERNMKCAAGFCGRCQYGPYFICKDGPIFRHADLQIVFGKPGF